MKCTLLLAVTKIAMPVIYPAIHEAAGSAHGHERRRYKDQRGTIVQVAIGVAGQFAGRVNGQRYLIFLGNGPSQNSCVLDEFSGQTRLIPGIGQYPIRLPGYDL